MVGEIERVYRTGYPSFLRVAVAVTGDEETARDAVHDAFVRAVRHGRGWRREAPLEGWLWRIVVNEARKRRARERRAFPIDPGAISGESTNGHAEEERAVGALVAALPERQRLVLFLRYYADLDYAAIAAALEIAPGTVAATLNAAHRKLRAQLKEVESC